MKKVAGLILAVYLPTGEGQRLTLLLRRIGRLDFETLCAPTDRDCVEISCKTEIGERETPIQALTRALVEQYNSYVANAVTLLSEPKQIVYQDDEMIIYGKVISVEGFLLYARLRADSGGLYPVTELDLDDIVLATSGRNHEAPNSNVIAMTGAKEVEAVEAAFVVLAAENAF